MNANGTQEKTQVAHSDETKAIALAMLAATNNNFRAVGRLMHLSHMTIRHWAKGRYVTPEVLKNVHIKKGELADRLEALLNRLLDAITPELIQAASLREIVVSLGIITDKLVLLRT